MPSKRAREETQTHLRNGKTATHQTFETGHIPRHKWLDVLWIDFTLCDRFFDKYYVATIPKSTFDHMGNCAYAWNFR